MRLDIVDRCRQNVGMTKTERPTFKHPQVDCYSEICGHGCDTCSEPGYVHKGDMVCPVAR